MGFGETCISAMTADQRDDQRVLFIVTTTTVMHWCNELRWVCPQRDVRLLGQDKEGNVEAVTSFMAGSHWLVMTYGKFTSLSLAGAFAKHLRVCCDLMVCDEAQTLCNSRSNVVAFVRRILTKKRLLLTATPDSNDLTSLFPSSTWLRQGALAQLRSSST
mmetsp:Transcript_24190/g.62338  ORF Transcript_24190/g.62338 Transcript_24190/m.62338 type:complete len:160 (-) Transcript_24190:1288-1767(-)